MIAIQSCQDKLDAIYKQEQEKRKMGSASFSDNL